MIALHYPMGNKISNLCLCSAGTGDISGRLQNTFTLLSKKHDKAICNSISYVRPNPPRISGDTFSDDNDAALMTFQSVAGATVSANSSSTSSISLDDSLQHSTVLDSSASFESFGSFTSPMMHPKHSQYQNQHAPRTSSVCTSVEEGLSSSPFDRVFNANSIEKCLEQMKMNKPNKISLKKVLSRVFSNAVSFGKGSIFKKSDNVNANANARVSCSTSLSDELRLHDNNYLDDDGDGCGSDNLLMVCENLHMAQGKGGEDRMHIVICEDHGWVYVGIYDGFNGPDATDYLLHNMFYAVHDELKRFLCNQNSKNVKSEDFSHSDVLEALSEAMRKTENAFLKIIDEMITHNPVLAMMGSCVLVMLMKGQDVYLMNVGDSRAVLATRIGNPLQLTMDHSTHVKEVVFATC